jgi:hypothetical protein
MPEGTGSRLQVQGSTVEKQLKRQTPEPLNLLIVEPLNR